MHKKSSAGTGTYSIIFGVAFVWFTTHFGGGFASGAQIYSYYVRFGIWCLIMPALAMLYNGIFFAYGIRFARKHEVYDYRSYNNAFYGKFAPVFSNLFEVLYICVMCVAPAVAFATGGATLSTLTGLPYLLCTLIIGIFIFIVAIFGTDLVRRVASVLSICIIAGLLIVYIPNIIHGWSAIRATAQQMTTSTQPFGKALYSAFLYGTFQLANIAVFCPARQSIQKTGRCRQKHGARLYHQRADDDDGLSWNYDRFHKPGYGRYQRTNTAYGAKRHWKRIYDTVNFHSDYPRCRIHRRKYGCRHGETCIRRT